MSSLALTAITLVLALGGAAFGMFLTSGNRFDPNSKTTVESARGLIITMVALLLSLQLSSARSAFDSQETQIAQIASEVGLLDATLRYCGPTAAQARTSLRFLVNGVIQNIWPGQGEHSMVGAPPRSEVLFERIESIMPMNEQQTVAKNNALTIMTRLGGDFRFIAKLQGSSTALPLLAVEISWITLVFIGLGMFASLTRTSIAAIVCAAFALAAAIFLIVEMSTPYAGYIRVSSTPMTDALQQLRQ